MHIVFQKAKKPKKKKSYIEFIHTSFLKIFEIIWTATESLLAAPKNKQSNLMVSSWLWFKKERERRKRFMKVPLYLWVLLIIRGKACDVLTNSQNPSKFIFYGSQNWRILLVFKFDLLLFSYWDIKYYFYQSIIILFQLFI